MNSKQLLELLVENQTTVQKNLNRMEGDLSDIKNDLRRIEGKIDSNGQRLDTLGLQLAELEDDSPTRDEFELLEQKVSTLSTKVSSV